MLKILIVEDEVLIANLIEDYITPYNYRCKLAVNYNQAIAILQKEQIDIALLDISISGSKTGIDVAHYINQNNAIPFLFLTSFSDDATIKKLSETTPVGYLSKPFKEIDVVSALNIQAAKIRDKSRQNFKLVVGKAKHRIHLDNLIYLQSDHIYIKLVFKESPELLLRLSIKNALHQLPKKEFIRVNRSVLVNSKYILKTTATQVELENGMIFKISSTFYDGG